jgi:hypothetical protein
MLATVENHPGVVDALIKAGADLNKQEKVRVGQCSGCITR